MKGLASLYNTGKMDGAVIHERSVIDKMNATKSAIQTKVVDGLVYDSVPMRNNYLRTILVHFKLRSHWFKPCVRTELYITSYFSIVIHYTAALPGNHFLHHYSTRHVDIVVIKMNRIQSKEHSSSVLKCYQSMSVKVRPIGLLLHCIVNNIMFI